MEYPENKDQDQSEKNPLLERKDKKVMPANFYNEKEKDYMSYLQKRLERARDQRNLTWPEFNNKSYIQVWEENEKIANTYLPGKKNDDDVIVSAGTVEAKMKSVLSHVNSLDLSGEVHAFDPENNRLITLGTALTHAIRKTEEYDGGEEGGDEEKKMMRSLQLLKQGTVFVQEEWLRLFEMKKKLKEGYSGQFRLDADAWTSKLEMVFEGPGRTMLHGPNVYLGDMTQYHREKQPYLFVRVLLPYDVAKTKYGKFENWDYVQPGAISDVPQEEQSIYSNKWRLINVKKDMVEILLYQDQPNDEFQIIINGVCMLPCGFPLSAVSPGGKYNITWQPLFPYNENFAYGRSFVSSGSLKELSALLDEMLKLFVLKTRKSITPPYINKTNRVISARVLSPGRISMGIPPNALEPIGQEGQGVNANEYQIYKELSDRIDKSTVSNQFTGQQGNAGTTATEVVELQRQAKLSLGLIVFANAMLEKKLTYLRLYNLLGNYFAPVETKIVNGKEVNRYRNVNREANIDGEGMGEISVIPHEMGEIDPDVIRRMELAKEVEAGHPFRMLYLDVNKLQSARLKWFVVVTPREKESSAYEKLQFREFVSDILTLMQLGSVPNVGGLEQEFSNAWGKDKNKLFSSAGQVSPDMAGVSPSALKGEMAGRGRSGLQQVAVTPSS